jgi:hypothetical protein
MYRNSAASTWAFQRPVVLTSAETKRIAGGALHKNDKAGGGPNPNMSGPGGGNPADPNPVGQDGDPPPFAHD